MREAADGRADILSRGRTSGVRPGRPKGRKALANNDGARLDVRDSLAHLRRHPTRARVVFLSTWWRRTRLSWRYRARRRARWTMPSRVSRIGKFDGRAFALHRAAAAFLRGCDARGSRSHATPRRRRRRPGQARPARARRRRRRRDALARASRAAPPRHPHGPPRPPLRRRRRPPRRALGLRQPLHLSLRRRALPVPLRAPTPPRPARCRPKSRTPRRRPPRATIGADPPRRARVTVFHPVPEGRPAISSPREPRSNIRNTSRWTPRSRRAPRTRPRSSSS